MGALCCCGGLEDQDRGRNESASSYRQHERERLIATPPPVPSSDDQQPSLSNDVFASRPRPFAQTQPHATNTNVYTYASQTQTYTSANASAPSHIRRRSEDELTDMEQQILAMEMEMAQARSWDQALAAQEEQVAEEQRIMELTSRHSVLESLPLTLFTPEVEQDAQPNECAICMDELALGDRVRFLPCLHRYHADCVDEWIIKKMTCPECNMDLHPNASSN
eukprot:TRINITY_DN10499_c0_g1_i1.p2 TRINITY_DN10499_c0_g1~~TRINITY_DN10499_c0_g1_i1.p2  ORF type:complete len:222 (+),score=21.65 TRINITY_DN10499_c0_g1_i1:1335-2000(+)